MSPVFNGFSGVDVSKILPKTHLNYQNKQHPIRERSNNSYILFVPASTEAGSEEKESRFSHRLNKSMKHINSQAKITVNGYFVFLNIQINLFDDRLYLFPGISDQS